MTAADESRRGGLASILFATAVAGIVGYAIQLLVPRFSSTEVYVTFSVLWSAVYLLVAATSGVQQEVARATSWRRRSDGSWRRLAALASLSALVLGAVVLTLGTVLGDRLFPSHAGELVVAASAAVGGYALIAVLSGALYGIQRLREAAVLTVSDVTLRAIMIFAALALGGTVVALAWATALPFVLSFLLVLAIVLRPISRHAYVDADLRSLVRNSAKTLGASMATGALVSGLPLFLGAVDTGLHETGLAALILVLTLTRAPLVTPLMAIQSYLIVRFRDERRRGRLLARWSTLLGAATALLAGCAAWLGPWVLDTLYDARYSLPAHAFAAAIVSAGATGLMFLVSPGLLAAGRHNAYLGGWATGALALILGLVIPPALNVALGLNGVLLVLMVAPLSGCAVMGWTLRRRSAEATRPT